MWDLRKFTQISPHPQPFHEQWVHPARKNFTQKYHFREKANPKISNPEIKI